MVPDRAAISRPSLSVYRRRTQEVYCHAMQFASFRKISFYRQRRFVRGKTFFGSPGAYLSRSGGAEGGNEISVHRTRPCSVLENEGSIEQGDRKIQRIRPRSVEEEPSSRAQRVAQGYSRLYQGKNVSVVNDSCRSSGPVLSELEGQEGIHRHSCGLIAWSLSNFWYSLHNASDARSAGTEFFEATVGHCKYFILSTEQFYRIALFSGQGAPDLFARYDSESRRADGKYENGR